MSLMVQHHSDTTTRLDDMITREEWDSAVAYMNEEKGQVDLRREDGTIVFEKAARAGAPLRFFKQGLRQIGEHKSKAIRAATGWIEEGTEQWLFLLDHESSGKVEAEIEAATIEFEKALDEWTYSTPTALENAMFELDQWGFTDSEMLDITLGDKEDIPFFLRTCLLGVARPAALLEGDEHTLKEATTFITKFMLDFDGFTPGSDKAIKQLKEYLGEMNPTLSPLKDSHKLIRVDFFRRLYEEELNLANFNDFFDGEDAVLPTCLTIIRSYLAKIPGCGVMKDVTDIAEVCLDKEFENESAIATIEYICGDLKKYFEGLGEDRAFDDALIGGFKGICAALVDIVEWFATQETLEEKGDEVDLQRRNLFATLQALHAEFNALLRTELQNDREKRDEVFGDIALMGEEQQQGVVRNRVLSGVGGESSKFWAMESYKRSIIHQSGEDCNRSDREIQRLKLAINASALPLAHKMKDYELTGTSPDMTDNEYVLLTKAEGAYRDLIKVEEIRKTQSMAMAVRAETYTDMTTALVKEVEIFLKLHRVLEKEETQLHHFFRNEEKLGLIREKRDKIIVKLEKRIVKK
ncbi:hypothetical protein TrVE_jg8126 [Triparma verrucosa]|uniref:Uncharacterized protein n=1 Tax=Triparma verrucosa TaxID=1606542 RepID=A0A9W7BQ00_9STRA|nr:hypothetical protein TrVE_jg8126 [Triparma verrucosa]